VLQSTSPAFPKLIELGPIDATPTVPLPVRASGAGSALHTTVPAARARATLPVCGAVSVGLKVAPIGETPPPGAIPLAVLALRVNAAPAGVSVTLAGAFPSFTTLKVDVCVVFTGTPVKAIDAGAKERTAPRAVSCTATSWGAPSPGMSVVTWIVSA
jgi:hypothetical protein